MKKVTITEKQATQFNLMRQTLIAIHKGYQTPDQLRRDSEKQYGLDYEESLEMSYENIQLTAKSCVKGIKPIAITP